MFPVIDILLLFGPAVHHTACGYRGASQNAQLREELRGWKRLSVPQIPDTEWDFGAKRMR